MYICMHPYIYILIRLQWSAYGCICRIPFGFFMKLLIPSDSEINLQRILQSSLQRKPSVYFYDFNSTIFCNYDIIFAYTQHIRTQKFHFHFVSRTCTNYYYYQLKQHKIIRHKTLFSATAVSSVITAVIIFYIFALQNKKKEVRLNTIILFNKTFSFNLGVCLKLNLQTLQGIHNLSLQETVLQFLINLTPLTSDRCISIGINRTISLKNEKVLLIGINNFSLRSATIDRIVQRQVIHIWDILDALIPIIYHSGEIYLVSW